MERFSFPSSNENWHPNSRLWALGCDGGVSWGSRTKVRLQRLQVLFCLFHFLLPLFISLSPHGASPSTLSWSSCLPPWPPPALAGLSLSPLGSRSISPHFHLDVFNSAFPSVGVFSLLASTPALQIGLPAQLPHLYLLISRAGELGHFFS